MSHWVLQSGLDYEAGWRSMIDTLQRLGIPYSIHKVIPFVGDLEPPPAPLTDTVICMGSYSMRHYANMRGWNPGVFDIEAYDFSEQRLHWGDAMLNADSEILAFGDVRFSGQRFIRPVDDSKAFAGRIFQDDDFTIWQDKVVALGDNTDTLGAGTLVQVSTPKKIAVEVRCWIVEGRVVTASVYCQDGRVVYSPDVDQRFVTYAESLAAEWAPEKAFCLDVCDTAEGLRVVEINTINSAGLYAADTEKLVLALDGLRR